MQRLCRLSILTRRRLRRLRCSLQTMALLSHHPPMCRFLKRRKFPTRPKRSPALPQRHPNPQRQPSRAIASGESIPQSFNRQPNPTRSLQRSPPLPGPLLGPRPVLSLQPAILLSSRPSPECLLRLPRPERRYHMQLSRRSVLSQSFLEFPLSGLGFSLYCGYFLDSHLGVCVKKLFFFFCIFSFP